MKGQELIIKFIGNFAFLTEEIALDFTQVKLPDSSVKFKAPAFWTVRVITHIENEHRLHLEIISYQVGNTDFSDAQIALADKLVLIEEVTFKSINTGGLLRTLSSTGPIRILHPRSEELYRNEISMQPQIDIKKELIEITYNEPFSIRIKDIKFLSGKIAFKKKIQKLGCEISFEIVNENIIEEYDSIKDYFANVLKTKKITVTPNITTNAGVIISISAKSNEIDKIDKSLIEEVKLSIVNTARRSELSNDKQIFTLDEYLNAFDRQYLDVQQIFGSEDELFKALIEKAETKHYKQLRFLSSKHRADLQKLRLVHKPFSFIFLLSNADKFHIVWETLDTQEATYIWSFLKSEMTLNEIFEQINETISFLVRNGKNDYVSRHETNFNRILHDYVDLQSGFANWKASIEKIIL